MLLAGLGAGAMLLYAARRRRGLAYAGRDTLDPALVERVRARLAGLRDTEAPALSNDGAATPQRRSRRSRRPAGLFAAAGAALAIYGIGRAVQGGTHETETPEPEAAPAV
jgi:hypothetical protein